MSVWQINHSHINELLYASLLRQKLRSCKHDERRQNCVNIGLSKIIENTVLHCEERRLISNGALKIKTCVPPSANDILIAFRLCLLIKTQTNQIQILFLNVARTSLFL